MDDHRGVLERITAVLADEFDVAGVATSGSEALERARRLDPDAIVLDINMPGLDGFETMRALGEAGSRAPVVFLSAVDADEYVREAFDCGGRGYVMKLRAGRDLVSALDQVLLGRVFVPSLSSLFRVATAGGHAMQVHRDLGTFLDGLAAFYDSTLRRGDAACIIATDDVREGLAARLRSRGWDVGRSAGHKRYMAVDASAALKRFMRNGAPDPGVLAEIASELDQYRRVVTDSASSRLTVFGNMVVRLIADGNPAAAIDLENHWNRLTRDLPFFTLCGYSIGCFHEGPHDLWSKACAEHWAVSHAGDV